jgi:hypothetical protein
MEYEYTYIQKINTKGIQAFDKNNSIQSVSCILKISTVAKFKIVHHQGELISIQDNPKKRNSFFFRVLYFRMILIPIMNVVPTKRIKYNFNCFKLGKKVNQINLKSYPEVLRITLTNPLSLSFPIISSTSDKGFCAISAHCSIVFIPSQIFNNLYSSILNIPK